VANPVQLRTLIVEGMQTKGFSLIEVMDNCPVHYGRLNKKGDAATMIKSLREQSVTVEQATKMTEEELQGKIVVGRMVKKDRKDYFTLYQEIIDAHKKG